MAGQVMNEGNQAASEPGEAKEVLHENTLNLQKTLSATEEPPKPIVPPKAPAAQQTIKSTPPSQIHPTPAEPTAAPPAPAPAPPPAAPPTLAPTPVTQTTRTEEKPKDVKQRVADSIKPDTTAVNEVYGKAKSSPKTTSNNQPVSDILVAIGLNDRFFYTRELFNNDSALFKSTVTKLNNLPSFGTAKDYLLQSFNWDQENETVDQFLTVVKRRYL